MLGDTKYRYPFIAIVCISISAAVLAFIVVLSPSIGLGGGAEFLLYKNFYWSRSEVFIICIAVLFCMSIISAVIIIHKRHYLGRIFGVISNRISWTTGKSVRVFGVISNRISWTTGKSVRVFALLKPTSAPPPNYDKMDLLGLVTASVIFQMFFIFTTKISFECDALTFFHFANFLSGNGGVYLPYRGPGFPLFLVVTGQTWLNTFNVTIFFHALFGIASPLFVYLSLRPAGRAYGLLAAILLIFSTVPFLYVKVMLPQQLFMILIVLAVYFFSRYYFTRCGRYIYATLILSLLSILTRSEGAILLLVFLPALAILACKKRLQFIHFCLSLVVIATIYVGHGGIRAAVMKDPSLWLSLSNWSGRQLFLQPYSVQVGNVIRLRQNIFETMKEGDERPILISPTNGPASQKLFKLIEVLYTDPGSYSYLEKLLTPEGAGYRKGEENQINLYEDLFGRFDGDPLALAENVFNNPQQVYFDNIWPLLDRKMGSIQSNKLFTQVSFEAVWANPDTFIVFLHNAFWLAGIDLLSILEGKSGINETFRQIGFWYSGTGETRFPYGGIVRNYVRQSYTYPDFNSAECASSNLPQSMFAEYEESFKAEMGSWVKNVFQSFQVIRVIILFVVGNACIFLFFTAFIRQHRVFWLTIAIVGVALTSVISVANTHTTKYDTGLQPLLIIMASGALIRFRSLFRNNRSEKKTTIVSKPLDFN